MRTIFLRASPNQSMYSTHFPQQTLKIEPNQNSPVNAISQNVPTLLSIIDAYNNSQPRRLIDRLIPLCLPTSNTRANKTLDVVSQLRTTDASLLVTAKIDGRLARNSDQQALG